MQHAKHEEQSTPPLTGSDAVAAIIVLEDGRYLLQQRDDIPRIWFPDHWGCFGGAVDPGEDSIGALKRELQEELEFEPKAISYFSRFDFDMAELGLAQYYRIYYVVPMTSAEAERLVLHEGKAVRAFSGEEVRRQLRVTPYDAFALFLHYDRHRIGKGWVHEPGL